jgi:hypothetical protein
MSSRDPQNPRRLLRRTCDLLTGAFLFVATAAFVLWQNTHLTVLWDLSYILENATRISLGQVPYRDFPFPYAPATFLVQAAISKLFGRVVLHHYLYAAGAAALATLLTWRILLRLLAASRLPARLIAFLLAAPLIFLGTGSIFPHPFYDSDCTLFILSCTWLLLRLESAQFPPLSTFACGILLAVPLFIKQNTGLAFLLSALVCIAYLGVRNSSPETRSPRIRDQRIRIQRPAAALLLAGAATGCFSALAFIRYTAGLANYYHWTIQFAASRRLPGLAAMLDVYRDPALLWLYLVFALGLALFLAPLFLSTLFRATPCTARSGQRAIPWLAATLLALPFVSAFAALFLQQDASDRVEALLHLWPVLLIASLALALWKLKPGRATTIAQLLPLILLGTIHGAFLSQQLWGSTYALWPFFTILLATILIALAPTIGPSGAPPLTRRFCAAKVGRTLDETVLPLTAFTAVASLVLLTTGAYYALSHERLDYADLSGDRLAHSTLPALHGLAMRGESLPDFEELVAYSDRNIPRTDAILMLPGEDLFYFTTGRTPQFPVLLLDNTVNPYSAAQIVELARQRNVGWLIVKRTLQLQEEPLSFRPQLLQLLSQDFEPTESLNNYDIYRRK